MIGRLALAGLLAVVVLAGAARGSAAGNCPSYNAPDSLVLSGGTPQSARLATAFAAPLQVELTNSNGCPLTTPLAGIAVTFVAPESGPSGTFASSGSNAVLVGTSTSGSAAAPTFTANSLTGGYTVTASSDYGSVTFFLVNTASGVNAAIAPAGTARQSAMVEARYSAPLQATVTDATGKPVGGASVTFSLGGAASSNSSGSAAAGATFDGGETQATAVTDVSGVARSPSFTANGVAGRFNASASTAGVAQPALYPLRNLAGNPPVLARHGHATQSAKAGARYGHPLEVVVRTAAGRPLDGTTVTFSLGSASGGAAEAASASFIGGSAQVTAVTDAAGVATSPLLTANSTVGRFTATASVSGVTRPVIFTLENLSVGTSLARHGRATQSAKAGARYGHPLEVVVRTAAGRPLDGTTVTFSLGSASGGAAEAASASFIGGSAQATAVTDAAGVATSPLLTANSTVGRFTATASVSGVTRPVIFTLENLSVGTSSIAPYRAGSNRATIGTSFPHRMKARVLDGSGDPVRGAAVTFALGAGSGTSAGATFAGGSAQATATTNAAGVATSPALTAGDVAGAFTATASSTAASGLATFSLRNLPAEPALVTAGAASGGSAPTGGRFPVRPAVKVTDSKGNPVPEAVVTFSAPAKGPSGKFTGHRRTVRITTDSTGVAVAPVFVANREAGGYALRATVPGAPPAAFALVNLPGG